MVDFLPPFLFHHLRAYMLPTMEKKFFHFLKPFDWSLWLAIFLTVHVFTAVKFFLSKISERGTSVEQNSLGKLTSE